MFILTIKSPDGDVTVSHHATYSEVVDQIRNTADPDGYYDDMGSGSTQYNLSQEGWEFQYEEVE